MEMCKDCAWYKAFVDSIGKVQLYGHCYVKPPVLLLMPIKRNALDVNETLQPMSLRPAVQNMDYCAEHSAVQARRKHLQ